MNAALGGRQKASKSIYSDTSLYHNEASKSRFCNVPDELKALGQWVLWKYGTINGKQTKVPYQAKHPGKKAATDNPRTWSSYQDALHSYQKGLADGIGFVFSPDDPYCGIDLDDCINPDTGEIQPWASDIVNTLDSYTELSPSGTGIHIIVRASLAELVGRKRNSVEMYDRGRYFTVTDNVIGDSRPIRDRQAAVEAVHAKHIAEAKSSVIVRHSVLPVVRNGLPRGDKFKRLYEYGDISDYASHSEADLALVSMILRQCQFDTLAADTLFRQSALYRPKWDEARSTEGKTYGQMTIDKAVAGTWRFNHVRENLPQPVPAPILDVDHTVTINSKFVTVDDLWDITEQHPNAVVLVQVNVGGGKTTALRDLAKSCHQGLALNPLRSLSAKLAQDLDATHYTKFSPYMFARQLRQWLVTTIHSLGKLKAGGKIPHFEIVTIDEVNQTFEALTQPNLIGEADVQHIREVLTHVLANATTIIGMSAHIPPFVVELFRQLAPDREIVLLKNKYQRHIGRTFSITTKDAAKAHMNEVVSRVAAGKRVAAPVDSRKHAQATDHALRLAREVETVLPNARVLTINSENADEPDQAAFLHNPNREVPKWDVIIYTPVVQSGVSIDKDHGFEIVAFTCAASLTAENVEQMCGRFRDVERIDIFSQKPKKRDRQTDAKKIESAIKADLSWREREIRANGSVDVLRTTTEQLRLTAMVEAHRNAQLNNHVEAIREQFRASGRTEVTLNVEITHDLYEQAVEAAKTERLQGVLNAPWIDANTYDDLVTAPKITEHARAIENYELRQFYGITAPSEFEAIVLADNEGQHRAGINKLCLAATSDELLERLKKKQLDQYVRSGKPIPDSKIKTLRITREWVNALLNVVGVDAHNLITEDGYSVSYQSDDGFMQRIKALACQKKRDRYQRHIEIPTARKLSDEAVAVKWVNGQLRQLGLRVTSKRPDSYSKHIYTVECSALPLVQMRFNQLHMEGGIHPPINTASREGSYIYKVRTHPAVSYLGEGRDKSEKKCRILGANFTPRFTPKNEVLDTEIDQTLERVLSVNSRPQRRHRIC